MKDTRERTMRCVLNNDEHDTNSLLFVSSKIENTIDHFSFTDSNKEYIISRIERARSLSLSIQKLLQSFDRDFR